MLLPEGHCVQAARYRDVTLSLSPQAKNVIGGKLSRIQKNEKNSANNF